MLSILSDSAFSHTKCAGPTIALTGTICILSVRLTTQMNPSTRSAQLCRSLYYVRITSTYSWAWGCNIHWGVFVHLIEKFDIIFPAGRCSWKCRIWLGEIKKSWIQEKKDHGVGWCYRGHCPYIGPRCYEILAWSLGWHWYILPCNQVPDAQQM